MTTEQKVIVCRLLDGQEMRGIAQSALEESVALVTLDETPPDAEFVLELHAPNTRPVVVLAVTAGEPMDDMFPVRLRPFDDEHYGQLLAFVCAADQGAGQPVTRWSQSIERTPSLLRLDTIPDSATAMGPDTDDHPSMPGVDPLIGRVLATDKYRIESLIGEGSAGAVYRCRHVALDKALAVKVLHPRFRADSTFSRRFHAEARAASRLDHTNVTRVQDFGEEPDGLLYIVMELLQGVDLRHLLHGGTLPRDRRIEILLSVLNALAAADDQGIVHRDIKPENVVVVASQNDDAEFVDLVKVCDFGLATVKPRVAGGTDIRQAAAAMSWVAGTPEYMSPEQILGEDLDIRSDLYACGVILFEMLTGQLPFSAPSVLHLMRMQLYDPPPPMRRLDPTIDARLEALTHRVLSKEPADRPTTPRELRNELREATRASRSATTGGWLPPRRPQPSNAPPAQREPTRLPAIESAARPANTMTPEQVADRIMANAESVVSAITAASTPQQFVRRLRAIVAAIPILLERGAVAPLAAVASTLAHIAEQPSTAADPRPALCARALEPIRQETRLVPVAEALLVGRQDDRDAARVLLQIGGAIGLQALVNARTKLPAARVHLEDFEVVVRAFGSSATPVLMRALAETSDGPRGGDAFVVEDLVNLLPGEPNPAFVALTNRLAHHGAAGVRRAVISRLPDLWGRESRSVLRVASRDPDESVRLAAIAGMRRIGAIDEAVIGLARDLLMGGSSASNELIVAAVAALPDAVASKRALAAEVLREAMRPRSRSLMTVLRSATTPADEAVVVEAVARALIALTGDEGRSEVRRRMAASRGDLRARLEQLLEAAS